ncbi:MAG: hypothetical protein KC636_38120, partial [Myxococcales bacterium]|nr:hypothetical protein [Myxococcales bacterium]
AILMALALPPARADACRPRVGGELAMARPAWSSGSLVLVDEQIELDCRRTGRRRAYEDTRCSVRARYEYTGEGPARGVFAPSGAARVSSAQVSINGRPVQLGRPVEDELVRADLAVDDGARVEVEVTMTIAIATDEADFCTNHAGLARHWVVATRPRRISVVVDGAPGAEANTRVGVRAPSSWRVGLSDGSPSQRSLDATTPSRAPLRLTLANRAVLHGPFVAAGVGFGPQVRARLRAGWEIAAPAFVLYSAAVEGDAVEELLVVPAIEVASPAFWGVIPSAGLAVGAPVMVTPAPRPGVRIQLALTWPYLGLVGNVDVYPSFDGLSQALRGSLMLQVTL